MNGIWYHNLCYYDDLGHAQHRFGSSCYMYTNPNDDLTCFDHAIRGLQLQRDKEAKCPSDVWRPMEYEYKGSFEHIPTLGCTRFGTATDRIKRLRDHSASTKGRRNICLDISKPSGCEGAKDICKHKAKLKDDILEVKFGVEFEVDANHYLKLENGILDNSLYLIDSRGRQVNEMTIANEGTWTIRGSKLVFVPQKSFKSDPSPIKVTAMDKNGSIIPERVIRASILTNPQTMNVLANDEGILDFSTLRMVNYKDSSMAFDADAIQEDDTADAFNLETETAGTHGTWGVMRGGAIQFTPTAAMPWGTVVYVDYTIKDINGVWLTPAKFEIRYRAAEPEIPLAEPEQ